VSPEIGYMGSVFYAKRSKDTTFFDRLANKKMKLNDRSILVQLVISRSDAHYQYLDAQKTDQMGGIARKFLFLNLLFSNKVVKIAQNYFKATPC